MAVIPRFQLTALMSAMVAAQTTPTIDSLGLLGNNTTVAFSYSNSPFLNNAGQQASMPSNLATGLSRDSNGWPLVAFSCFASKSASGLAEGQLDPSITYHCSYVVDLSNPTHATPGTGMTWASMTVTNVVVKPDGVTTTFDMKIDSLANAQLTFNGGITYLDIPRGGSSTSTIGGPEFYPPMVAHYAKFTSMRAMDLCGPISNPETTWSGRIAEYGPTQPGFGQATVGAPIGQGYSWERLFRLFTAVKNAAGSKLRYVFFSLPAKVDDNYVTQLAILALALMPAGVTLRLENGNEPWNFTGEDDYGTNYYNAFQECQVATTYGTLNFKSLVNIANMSSNGTTVTVTIGAALQGYVTGSVLTVTGFQSGAAIAVGQTLWFNGASTGLTVSTFGTGTGGAGTYNLSGSTTIGSSGSTQALVMVGGALPAYITTGATMVCAIDAGLAGWKSGSLAHPTTITVSGSTFTYTANTANGDTIPASGATAPTQAVFHFNLASTLLADGLSFSLNALSLKWYVRRSLQMRNLWKVYRPNDQWYLNLQFASFGGPAPGGAVSPIYLAYADWLGKNYTGGGGGASGWLKALAVAPYCNNTSTYTTAAVQAGPSVIHGVPWAPYAQVGSTVKLNRLGPGGGTLTTTVASGSSGTDLMVTDAVSTAVTAWSNNNILTLSTSIDTSGTEICNFLIYSGIPMMEGIIRCCAYNARLYGLELWAYEIGPDTQAFPTLQTAIHTNPLIGTLVSQLLDTWASSGAGVANYFSCVPYQNVNTISGGWGTMTSWSDSTSPKVAAVLAQFAKPRVISNRYGVSTAKMIFPGDFTTKIGTGGGVTTLNAAPSGGQSTQVVFWFSNTSLRNADWVVPITQAGNYTVTVWLTEGTTGSPGLANVLIDGVQVGTAQSVSGTGAGTSTSAVPQKCASFTIPLTVDYHNLSVQFPAGIGSSPGIYQVDVEPAAAAPAPSLVTTDIVAGKLVNGENNAGDYMRIIGANLGTSGNLGTSSGLQVFFRDTLGDNNWHEVASYRTLTAQRVTPSGLQEACVQIGSLGGSQVAGRALDMKVTVAGVSSNVFTNYFTVQPGNVWFVSTSGSDSTGAANDIAHPFRYAQVWTGSTFTGLCASGKLAPGDTVVFRGGAYTADEQGYNAGTAGANAVFRFATTGSWATGVGGGSAPTGATGHGYIHFTAYPGEDVHFTLSKGGGIQGVESSFASSVDGGHGQFVSISGIHWEMSTTSTRDGSGINGQNGARHWRAVSNELGPWPTSTGTTNAGGITGVFQESFLLYNDIHDISGNLTDKQNHGIYYGGATGGSYDDASKNLKISGNWIRNCTAGSGIQGYWQNTNNTATSVMTGIEVSGNWIDTTAKYGINLGQSSVSGNVFNNQVINTGLNSLRIEGLAKLTGQADLAIVFAFNTCYGWNTAGSIHDSWFITEGYANYGSVKVDHNIAAAASGRSTTNSWYENTAFGGADANLTMSQNINHDYAGTLTGSAAKDAAAITTSPAFTNRAGKDFTLGTGSSALNAVTTADVLTLLQDIMLNARPKGAHRDIGAFET